ncbi:ABC transporter permease [Subtercola frigoramans]|uniref:Autoinducer 2 import system permease protein LsrD n=1 Tax=Subtercola frigoramans TaxID=120298 RepID=A0ABS2L091_9MICO|nr:ABC transporter permease [Subtercola frigoramans]MBM7470483.1 ribose/xylose/arabinose/galactoside ABC-type transport system permease subunit [Subtercola frigoramans]
MSTTMASRGDFIVQRILLGNKAALFAVIFGVALSIGSPYFLTASNLGSLLDQIVVISIVAFGFTFLLGAGEIDLSITGVVPLVGVISAKSMTEFGFPAWAAVLVGIVVGALCGLINAAIVNLFELPAFIVTFAAGAVYIGITYVITNLVPVSQLPPAFVAIGQGRVGVISVATLILIPVFALFVVVSRSTVFAQHLIAMAVSPQAVRVAGISIPWMRVRLFTIAGACYGFASVLLTARSASAQISAGSTLLLLVVAAVVIGGTPLLGGKIAMVGTLFGCLVIGMISNGMNLLGVNANFQIIWQGLLILLALFIDVNSTKLAARMAKRRMMRTRVEI